SYPLGFLMDRNEAPEDFKSRFARQGDPDFQAFHHDLYRTCGALRAQEKPQNGRWWVMEQQPGPVNWAPWNPAPLPGMARLWAWEAFAHGAEAVCYFRWRQAPFAQEQQHSGLKRPDNAPAPGLAEAAQVARELAEIPDAETAPSPVALIFDYDSAYAWETQPQGKDFDYFHLVFETYRALRKNGLSIDIIPADGADFSAYKLIFAPGLLHLAPERLAALADSGAHVVFGPRTGLKTAEFSTALPLGPGIPGLQARVSHVESLPPAHPVRLQGAGHVWKWFEHLEGDADVLLETDAGQPVLVHKEKLFYLAGWLDPITLESTARLMAIKAGLEPVSVPLDLRVRDTATHRFWFNYSASSVTYGIAPPEQRVIPAASVVWEPL
ncbi:MAG: beta-galactosidase, partial [Pseudomonadota bacterium]